MVFQRIKLFDENFIKVFKKDCKISYQRKTCGFVTVANKSAQTNDQVKISKKKFNFSEMS